MTLPVTIPTAPLIEELLGHLGAAKMQLLPTDDRLIADHVKAAHTLALMLFRSTRT